MKDEVPICGPRSILTVLISNEQQGITLLSESDHTKSDLIALLLLLYMEM